MTSYPFQPDWTVAPGETLAEWSGEYDPELARLTDAFGGNREGLDALLAGRRELTVDDALTLEQLTGIPVGFWLQMEANYRSDLIRLGRASTP